MFRTLELRVLIKNIDDSWDDENLIENIEGFINSITDEKTVVSVTKLIISKHK